LKQRAGRIGALANLFNDTLRQLPECGSRVAGLPDGHSISALNPLNFQQIRDAGRIITGSPFTVREEIARQEGGDQR
jgi:hypothetical protein